MPGLSFGIAPILQFAKACDFGLFARFANAIYTLSPCSNIASSNPPSVTTFAFRYKFVVSELFEITLKVVESGEYKFPVLSVIFAVSTGLEVASTLTKRGIVMLKSALAVLPSAKDASVPNISTKNDNTSFFKTISPNPA